MKRSFWSFSFFSSFHLYIRTTKYSEPLLTYETCWRSIRSIINSLPSAANSHISRQPDHSAVKCWQPAYVPIWYSSCFWMASNLPLQKIHQCTTAACGRYTANPSFVKPLVLTIQKETSWLGTKDQAPPTQVKIWIDQRPAPTANLCSFAEILRGANRN